MCLVKVVLFSGGDDQVINYIIILILHLNTLVRGRSVITKTHFSPGPQSPFLVIKRERLLSVLLQ